MLILTQLSKFKIFVKLLVISIHFRNIICLNKTFTFLLNTSISLDKMVIQVIGVLQTIFVPSIIIIILSLLIGKSTGVHPIGMILCCCIIIIHTTITTQMIIVTDSVSNQVCILEHT